MRRIAELVRLDLGAPLAPKLRIWNRIAGTLVERDLAGGPAPPLVLDLHWVIAPADGLDVALRIGGGTAGSALPPTRREARRAKTAASGAEAEARLAEAEAPHAEAIARRLAEARVRELEAELAAVRGR